MNIEQMGKKVSEALALQGRVDSLAEEINVLQGQINTCDMELSRVPSLEQTKAVAVKSLATAQAEFSKLSQQLEERLKGMEREGIKLPLGAKQIRSSTL